MKTKGVPIKIGEFFRVGKYLMRIPEQRINKNEEEDPLKFTLKNLFSFNHKEKCRICFKKETLDDRFSNLCNCSRNMAVHLSCLTEWITFKAKKETHNFVLYSFTNIHCEICNKELPHFFTNQSNKQISLIQAEKNFEKYCVLEFRKLDTPNKVSSILIFNLNHSKKTYSIGKSPRVDIQIEDQSLEFVHCHLKLGKDIRIIDVNPRGKVYILKKQVNFKKGREYTFELRNWHIVIHRRFNSCCNPKKNIYLVNPLDHSHTSVLQKHSRRMKLQLFKGFSSRTLGYKEAVEQMVEPKMKREDQIETIEEEEKEKDFKEEEWENIKMILSQRDIFEISSESIYKFN